MKKKVKSKKDDQIEGVFIPGGALVGLGAGFLLGNIVAGLLLGLGLGFILFGITASKKKK